MTSPSQGAMNGWYTCVSPLFTVPLLFLLTRAKVLVNVPFIPRNICRAPVMTQVGTQTWLPSLSPVPQQHPGFRRAGESFEQMNGLFSTGGKHLSRPELFTFMVSSIVLKTRFHSKTVSICTPVQVRGLSPVTEEWKSEAGLGPCG